MPNPWVSLRCDQLIPVNKAVNENEQLENGLEEEEEINKGPDRRKFAQSGHPGRHPRCYVFRNNANFCLFLCAPNWLKTLP
jgi:hypothetical protein